MPITCCAPSPQSVRTYMLACTDTHTQMHAGTQKRTHTPDLEVTSQQHSVAEEDFFFCIPENVLPPPRVHLSTSPLDKWRCFHSHRRAHTHTLKKKRMCTVFLIEGESGPSLPSLSRSVLWSFHGSDGFWDRDLCFLLEENALLS